MSLYRLLVFVAGFGLAANSAVAGSDSITGLAWTCAGCHGPDGVSPGRTIPTIAGLRAKHIADALYRYREGSRDFYVMRFIAKGLDDSEIDRLSDYFAARPFAATAVPADRGLAGKGAALAQSCDGCHGAGGAGSGKAPRLAGQPAPYLNAALLAYASGGRTKTAAMVEQIKPLSKADLLNLSHYYASRK